MRALVARDYGPPSGAVLAEVADPKPGPEQVLVTMEAAALNPFDLKLLTGAVRDVVPVQFPYVIGMDGAGTVAAVGEAVTRFAPGEPVFGLFGASSGTIAEYAVISDGPLLERRPADVDPVHAAAIPQSGLTALTLLRAAQAEARHTMLVVGATGGIGMFVVQLAAARGVNVVATAASSDADYVRRLGAAHSIDYTSSDVVDETLRLHPGGVDVVVDLVSHGDGIASIARAVRPGGRLLSPLFGPTEVGRDVRVAYVALAVEPGDLDDLAARVASRSLHIEVARPYRFDEAPQALVDFAARHTTGKIVVAIRGG